MIFADRDPGLRHFERDAALACLVMAAIALAVQRGRPDAAAGVIGGGLLMAVSYRAIKGGVDVVVELARRAGGRDATPPATGDDAAVRDDEKNGEDRPAERAEERALPAGRKVALAVKFFTRYALLAVGAYVMLSRFRLHPVGLLAGAASPFLAAAVQVVRLSRGSWRSSNTRS